MRTMRRDPLLDPSQLKTDVEMAIQRWIVDLAESVPQFKRGLVWCHACGQSQRVEVTVCLQHGWPTHCGRTMSIDRPEEHG
jgi:hypothetical protein